MSVRYNEETDYIQIFNGSKWIDWKPANMKTVYLFKNGEFNIDYPYEFYHTGSTSITVSDGLLKISAPNNQESARADVTFKNINYTRFKKLVLKCAYVNGVTQNEQSVGKVIYNGGVNVKILSAGIHEYTIDNATITNGVLNLGAFDYWTHGTIHYSEIYLV